MGLRLTRSPSVVPSVPYALLDVSAAATRDGSGRKPRQITAPAAPAEVQRSPNSKPSIFEPGPSHTVVQTSICKLFCGVCGTCGHAQPLNAYMLHGELKGPCFGTPAFHILGHFYNCCANAVEESGLGLLTENASPGSPGA